MTKPATAELPEAGAEAQRAAAARLLEPVGVLASADWRLAARSGAGAALRWGVLVPIAVLAAVLLLAPVAGFVAALSLGPAAIEPRRAAVVAGMVFGPFAVTVLVGLFERWALGRGSVWGRAVTRLTSELPACAGSARASFPFVSGLRFRSWRAVYVLFPPDRLILVSRGWHGSVITALAIWCALGTTAFTLGGMPKLDDSVPMMGLCFVGVWTLMLVAGRRVDVHEVPYDDIEGAHPLPRRIDLAVRGSFLGRTISIRPFSSDREAFFRHLRAHRPDLLADGAVGEPAGPSHPAEGLLAHVQERLQEE